ncbi:uncharacterized protein LOC135114726 [Scylla paramamosain]|uniref:uncharacterized protein LOC135114726 n=1 Tax=Scylla paramamosain TaxID=85552 RepID=UPI0030830C3A
MIYGNIYPAQELLSSFLFRKSDLQVNKPILLLPPGGREQVAEITLARGVSCDTAYPALRNPYVEEQWEDKGRRAARSAVPPQSHLKPPEEDADGSEVDAPQCCTKQAFSVSLEGSEP